MRTCVVLLLVCLAIASAVRQANGKGPKDKTPPGLVKKQQDPTEGEETTCAEYGGHSCSRKKVTGWFRIHVVGTGKKCIIKEKDKTKTDTEEFGEFASTDAFIQFYGEPECEAGDKGVAQGRIRASVLAEAAAIGPECVAKVLTYVSEAAIKTHKKHTDVSVDPTAEAGGDALTLCET